MRRALATIALLAGAMPAHAAPVALPPGDHVLPFVYLGAPRVYALHVPPCYDGSQGLPLVLLFHGTFGNMRNIDQKAGFSALADKECFLVLSPQAFGAQWDDGRKGSVTRPPVDDVAFIEALLDHVETLIVNVDADRVYATGMSSGGFLSYALGAKLSTRIAAIGPVAGVTGPEAWEASPERPVSVVAFNGTDDPLIGYDGRDDGGEIDPSDPEGAGPIIGDGFASVPETIAHWVEIDGCPTTPTIEDLPDIAVEDGTRVQRISYGPCEQDTEVILYRIIGGGHAWPGDTGAGLKANRGLTSYDVNATSVMWDFFSRHPRSMG